MKKVREHFTDWKLWVSLSAFVAVVFLSFITANAIQRANRTVEELTNTHDQVVSVERELARMETELSKSDEQMSRVERQLETVTSELQSAHEAISRLEEQVLQLGGTPVTADESGQGGFSAQQESPGGTEQHQHPEDTTHEDTNDHPGEGKDKHPGKGDPQNDKPKNPNAK